MTRLRDSFGSVLNVVAAIRRFLLWRTASGKVGGVSGDVDPRLNFGGKAGLTVRHAQTRIKKPANAALLFTVF